MIRRDRALASILIVVGVAWFNVLATLMLHLSFWAMMGMIVACGIPTGEAVASLWVKDPDDWE